MPPSWNDCKCQQSDPKDNKKKYLKDTKIERSLNHDKTHYQIMFSQNVSYLPLGVDDFLSHPCDRVCLTV